MSIKYYVIDLETTGLDKNYHEICEISIIRCEDKVQLTEHVICEYPDRASLDSLAITKKSINDLSKGITKEAALAKVNKFLEEDGVKPSHRCMVAHNYSFDLRFIHQFYEKQGLIFPADLWLCTRALSKKFAKSIGQPKASTSLVNACDLVGIKKFAGAHSSKVDTRNTYLLMKDLIDVKQIDYIDDIKLKPHYKTNDNEDDCYQEPIFD